MTFDIFADRTLVIATMHGKESVIGPLLADTLKVKIHTPADFDTDRFGTFTRDRDRPGTQRETALMKVYAALEATGESLGVASEGAFGPHPFVPFIPGNIEMVALVDTRHNLEVVGQKISSDTNFGHGIFEDLAEGLAFAKREGFPDHGMVVLPAGISKLPFASIKKGICSEGELIAACSEAALQSPISQFQIEADMRAHMNPTRMRVIYDATTDLLARLNKFCPQCGLPGFDVTDAKPGLPCGWCRFPSQRTLSVTRRCRGCGHAAEQIHPEGLKEADPGECTYCNP